MHLPLDHLMHMILCRSNFFLSVSSCASTKSCSLGSLGKPQLFRLWLSPCGAADHYNSYKIHLFFWNPISELAENLGLLDNLYHGLQLVSTKVNIYVLRIEFSLLLI